MPFGLIVSKATDSSKKSVFVHCCEPCECLINIIYIYICLQCAIDHKQNGFIYIHVCIVFAKSSEHYITGALLKIKTVY